MGHKNFQQQRARTLEPLHGTVLEVGFGTGLNLPHYPTAVTWLTAVEPENTLPQTVARRSIEAPMPVEIIRVSAEKLPFQPESFDCVLSTWTLCTIPDVVSALKEIRRVLKPEGFLVFLEHGRSDDPRLFRWQKMVNPFQRFFACGCQLTRPIDALIEQAGLQIGTLDRFQMEGIPKIAAQMYRGIATPSKT